MNNILGTRLRELRLNKQMTQEQVGQLLGESKETIYKWEKGLRNLKPEDLKKASDLFGCTSDYLIGKADNPNGVYHFYSDPELGPITIEYPSEYQITQEEMKLFVEELKEMGCDVKSLLEKVKKKTSKND